MRMKLSFQVKPTSVTKAVLTAAVSLCLVLPALAYDEDVVPFSDRFPVEITLDDHSGAYRLARLEIDIDAAVPLVDVEAVEAHSSIATLPSDFNRVGAQCGVIAFWTRHADPRVVSSSSRRTSDIVPVRIWNSSAFHFLTAVGVITIILLTVGRGIHF